MKAIKRLWNYITSAKYAVGDMIWQLDHDVDALNALIIEATKK
jgi:hypothetical protein